MRRVRWLTRVSRDNFSAPSQNSMGSTITVFRLDEHLEEIHRIATKDRLAGTEVDVAPPFFEEVKAHYEALESEYKAKIPLRKVWVPAE